MKFFDKCSIFSKIMTESCHPCLKVWIFDVMLKEVENGLKVSETFSHFNESVHYEGQLNSTSN